MEADVGIDGRSCGTSLSASSKTFGDNDDKQRRCIPSSDPFGVPECHLTCHDVLDAVVQALSPRIL